jgi:hypothetical protein
MTATWLSATRSCVEPGGAVSVMPGTKAHGDSDRSPPEVAYRHLETASAACSAVSICGKMIPAAPRKGTMIRWSAFTVEYFGIFEKMICTFACALGTIQPSRNIGAIHTCIKGMR